MRPAHALSALAVFAVLALLASEGSRGQDKKAESSVRPTAKGQLPKYWDQLGLSEAQRTEVLRLTAEQKEKTDKLREEIKKLDEEFARKRVKILTDDQRKKLIDLVAGPDPKEKAEHKAKGK